MSNIYIHTSNRRSSQSSLASIIKLCIAADALSRRPPTDAVLALSVVTPQWLDDVCSSYQSDPEALAILAKLAINGVADSHFSLDNGLIRYDGKIWLGSNSELQLRVLCLTCNCSWRSFWGTSHLPSNPIVVLLEQDEI